MRSPEPLPAAPGHLPHPPKQGAYDRIKPTKKSNGILARLRPNPTATENAMSTLNRRDAIAGAIALPTAAISAFNAAPAAASASSTSSGVTNPKAADPKADPIFALIKEHRRARSKFERALHKLAGAQRRFQREFGVFYPGVQCTVPGGDAFYFGKGATPEEMLASALFIKACDERQVSAATHEEIDRIISDPEKASAYHIQLDHVLARYEEIVGPHLKADDEHSDVDLKVLEKIFSATATTPEGIRALISYALEKDSRGCPMFEDAEDAFGFLKAIERSSCRFAS